MRRRWNQGLAALGVIAALSLPATARAQVRWLDLVLTGGVSGEGYEGNLASATVPVVDSTDEARAAVGEFGVRGALVLLERSSTLLQADFDLGMRQFAATGFQVRDYAPREWVGQADLTYRQGLGRAGVLFLGAGFTGRSVTDRPPMPLFLQPAYQRLTGSARYLTPSIQGVRFDVVGGVEGSNYEAPRRVTQLDLLDRNSVSVEVGARWGVGFDIRFYTGFRQTEYPHQGSFDESDPFRRDHAVTVGAQWRWESTVVADLGVEGIVNRSNSRRPEYDAFTVTAQLAAPLPWWGLRTNLYGVLTGKSYVYTTPFARLVPGEEADNASVLYLNLSRSIADNLDASVRVGWTKAETDIGQSYFRRSGVSFLLSYRPLLH